MSVVKPALQKEPSRNVAAHDNVARLAAAVPRRVTQSPLAWPSAIRPVAVPITQPRREPSFQPRVPVITGEATFRGTFAVHGIVSGQLGAAGSALTIKQRPKSGPTDSQPELNGELSFKDMLRINGHVAGKVTSPTGTLIVDLSALVDGDIDVGALVISGTVNGDVIGHDRVELGPAAVINGNISTRTLTMKPGAVFQGDCRMLKDRNGEK